MQATAVFGDQHHHNHPGHHDRQPRSCNSFCLNCCAPLSASAWKACSQCGHHPASDSSLLDPQPLSPDRQAAMKVPNLIANCPVCHVLCAWLFGFSLPLGLCTLSTDSLKL
eukprot:jgi/Chrzof1/13329/Cz07g29030.t1